MRTPLRHAVTASVLVCLAVAGSAAWADNQTPTTTPVTLGSDSLPFDLELKHVNTPSTLPTLQAFVSAQSGKLWVLLGGRTNGLHNFTTDPLENFPPSSQNDQVWVIDPDTWQVWSRKLSDSGLTEDQVDQLGATNYEWAQDGKTLYIVGGYGYSRSAKDFVTFPYMTAVNLSDLVKWVQKPAKSPPLEKLIRQTTDETLRVTGGQMALFGKRAILAFGQDFAGGYFAANTVQTYTGQVRSFDIVDKHGELKIDNISADPATPDLTNFRRRDYDLVPFIDKVKDKESGNKGKYRFAALAGVFTPTDGVFTVPVEIGSAGTPVQADPSAASTFKQGMNGYDCATLAIYDSKSGATHMLLFGGISYVTYDFTANKFVEDSNIPFTSEVTDLVRDSEGVYSQHVFLKGFPTVSGPDVQSYLFGANAHVFLDPKIKTKDYEIVDMKALGKKSGTTTTVGWVFGGIAAEQPNFGNSVASNQVFEINLTLH